MRAPALLLLASLLAAPTARGDDPAQEATLHFQSGLRDFDLGEYDRAVEQFQTAWRLKPHPDLLINIATSYERLYRPHEAREAYERFLHDAPLSSPLRSLADKRLRVLRALPGSILVEAGKAGADITLSGTGGARDIQRSDRAKDDEDPVTFSNLPPATYHVHVAAAGYLPIDQDVTLAPNESHALTQHLQAETEVITLFSVPDGAHVFIDDQDTGEVTPFTRRYPVGPHDLRLELPDRRPQKEHLALEVGHPFYRRVILPAPPRSGRAEMAVAGMVFGGYFASALTVAIGGSRVTVGNGLAILVPTTVAGVGLGFLASWVLTDNSMRVGHSSLIIGSTVWGTFAGLSLSFGLGLTANGPTQQNPLAISLLGGGLGMGAGILSAWLVDPSPGDSALVNSGALWGTFGAALLTESISFRKPQHDKAFGWLTLGGNAAGLTTGALLARALEPSRAQLALIDAAGLAGALLGYGIGYAAGNDVADNNSGTLCVGPVNRCVSGARYALGGAALGLLTAALLSRRIKFEVPRADGLLQLHDDRWALGLPALRLDTAPLPHGFDQRAVLDLARGEW